MHIKQRPFTVKYYRQIIQETKNRFYMPKLVLFKAYSFKKPEIKKNIYMPKSFYLWKKVCIFVHD
jgi:hypothetical protein